MNNLLCTDAKIERQIIQNPDKFLKCRKKKKKALAKHMEEGTPGEKN